MSKMMTNILEKTIGSVFTGSGSDQFAGLKSLYQKCLAARTKSEETIIIKQLLSTVKFRLSNPSTKPLLAGHCLAFAIFAELMGYNVDFAHIHAINLAQQPSIVEKKMGYVACCCLLSEKNELNLLLVNTLVRDLSSTNVAIVGLALCALCSAPLPTDAIPSVLPAVIDRLHHSTAYVRCRAVIAVHHLMRRHPDQCKQIVGNVVGLLGDEDPHVVQRVLACLPDIIQKNPEEVPGLVQPLVAIQRQILGGRLPPDMMYKGLHAPWMQLSIIRCLPELCLTEEDEFSCKEVLLETVQVCSQKVSCLSEPPIRGAILSLSLSALLSLEEPNEASKVRVMQYVTAFLQSGNSDIKNEGLFLLEQILTKYQITLTEDQQSIVKSSLDHSDVSIQRRALGLMTAGASEKDIQSVCGQLFTHAVNSKDGNLKQWLLEQALQLIDRFPKALTDDWKLSAFIKLMPLAEDIALGDNLLQRVRYILVTGDCKAETRRKLLSVLIGHGESKRAPTSLLKLFIWTLGHFPQLSPGGTQTSLNQLLTLGNKVMKNAKTDDRSSLDLLRLIVCSIQKMTEDVEFKASNDLEPFLREVSSLSAMHLAETSELSNSLLYLGKIRNCMMGQTTEFDCSLSALDYFVFESIQSGESKPYQSQVAMQVFQPKPIRSPEPSHLLPVVLPETLMQISQESNKVSDESWSAKSPEPTSPEPIPKSLWTKEGRVASPSAETGTFQSDPLAQALGFSQKVFVTEASPVTEEDPLGELLR